MYRLFVSKFTTFAFFTIIKFFKANMNFHKRINIKQAKSDLKRSEKKNSSVKMTSDVVKMGKVHIYLN